MVFNLNIVDLIIVITTRNKLYFIYKKIYYSIKLSTILLYTKFIRQELQN